MGMKGDLSDFEFGMIVFFAVPQLLFLTECHVSDFSKQDHDTADCMSLELVWRSAHAFCEECQG